MGRLLCELAARAVHLKKRTICSDFSFTSVSCLFGGTPFSWHSFAGVSCLFGGMSFSQHRVAILPLQRPLSQGRWRKARYSAQLRAFFVRGQRTWRSWSF